MSQTKSTQSRRFLYLGLLLALFLALWVQLPRLLNPDIMPPDFLKFYWVHGFRNPELFPRSFVSNFSFEWGSYAYILMLRAASWIMDPVLFGKLLVFALIGLVVYFSYRIALPFTGAGTALALSLCLAVIDLAGPTDWSTAAGLQRSFQLPFLLALAYYLMNRRYLPAALVVALSGLIYLPILPVSALFYGLTLLRRPPEGRWLQAIRWRPLLFLAGAIAVVLVVIWPLVVHQLSQVGSGATAATGAEHILSNPTYSSEGRYPLFVSFPLVGRAGLFGTWNIASVFILFCILGIFVSLIRRRPIRPPPPVLVNLLIASLIMFALSWLVLILTSSLLLYLPNRHTRVPLLLVSLFYVFFNLEDSLQTILAWFQTNRRQATWFLSAIVLASGAVVLFLPVLQSEWYERLPWLRTARWLLLVLTAALSLLLPLYARQEPRAVAQRAASGDRQRRRGRWLLGMGLFLLAPLYFAATPRDYYEPTEAEMALYTYLESLPVDAMIAGEPCTLDFVPFYARRGVLLTCVRPPAAPIVLDALDAYYAEDRQQLVQFCRQYEVDYLVVDKQSFDRRRIASGGYFFEPFTSQLHDRISSRAHYYLDLIPPEQWLFQSAGRFVVPCGPQLPKVAGEQ